MPSLSEHPAVATPSAALDVQAIRRDFPILAMRFHGKPLVYLDNAATSQKPRAVIERLEQYYSAENANIHRGVYELSQLATNEYELARLKVQKFLNAAHPQEIIFTRGTTEAINLVSQSYGRTFLRPGDEVIISQMEHHSNIVPWQIVCQQTGAILRVIPMNDAGQLIIEEYARMFSPRTRFVSVVHLSNVLGTINPVKHIIHLAHQHNVPVMIDGAQWAPHGPTDVQDLDADFYAFSGHKMYGPTGIGVLYGKQRLLETMPPWQGGGDMIASVSFERTTYAELPSKFEAGTPNIAGAIGLGAAIDYVSEIGFDRIVAYEQDLLQHAAKRLEAIPGLRLLSHAACRAGAVSFVMEDPPIASLDIGTALDRDGIAIRTGHHCCQPLMDRMGVPSTARASVAFYNTHEEIDQLADALLRLRNTTTAARPQRKPAPAAELNWPQPAGDSVQSMADELADVLEFLGDRDARNQYILELGEKVFALPEQVCTPKTRVHGCMSTVHMVGRKRPGTAGALDLLADSDAHIVRGLIALLLKLFSGQPAADILSFDVEAFFRRVNLDQFISSQRRSGLGGMVQRIKALAAKIQQQGDLSVEEQL